MGHNSPAQALLKLDSEVGIGESSLSPVTAVIQEAKFAFTWLIGGLKRQAGIQLTYLKMLRIYLILCLLSLSSWLAGSV